ncbi:MAG: PilN domain-containing protein [Candidatus Curtissbacteria bacterium]|nr:PilN domain-containing protein [Candidatus Curtissbacteria bacterium]
MADINLLPVEEKSAERFENLYKKLVIAAIFLLVFTAVSTLAILGFFSILSTQRSNLVGRVEVSSATIEDLKSVEELQVVVKQKTAVADKIIIVRSSLGDVFQTLVQLVPQGVFFTDMRFSGLKVVISGRARTSGDVAGLVAQLVSARGNQIFSAVAIDSLSSDEAGIYSFVLSAQLIK